MYGKQIRLKRIFPDAGRKLFSVPLDHSVSMGPIDGLESVAPVARALQAGGVDLLIVTKGAVREVAPVLGPRTLLGIHISASTSLGPDRTTRSSLGPRPRRSRSARTCCRSRSTSGSRRKGRCSRTSAWSSTNAVASGYRSSA